jgi:chromosome segregation ATPase
MFDTITIVLVLLTLSALAAAGFAIVSLSKVKNNLSELGMRVLESEDVGKIKEAANKTGSFESRLAGFEQKADESKNQLAELKTKLNELNEHKAEHKTRINEFADKLRASEQKIASLEGLLDELSTKLGSVEQMVGRNEDGLAQTVPNIKALADEIQGIKKFQTAIEKVHSLIQCAITDMQESMSPKEGLETMPQDTTPEDALKRLEEWQQEDDPQRATGSRRWQS